MVSAISDGKYDAFISYSRKLDEPIAIALQSGLHRLAKPWYRLRALRVFRDNASLSANPDLWHSIRDALDRSEYFILLASPDAAASRWVSREVDHWLDTKPPTNLLIALTDGELDWDPTTQTFRSPAPMLPLPASLIGKLVEEPRYVDLRWARQENLSLTHPRFRDAVAEVAAPLHGQAKDELIGDDIREHRRTTRWRNSAIAGLGVLLIVAVVAAVLAIIQRNTAGRERDTATSRSLAAASVNAARSRQLDLALLLAVQSRAFSDTREARDGLLNALQTEPQLIGYLRGHQNAVQSLIVTADGLVSMDSAGEVRSWDVPAAVSQATRTPVEPGLTAALSPEGRRVAVPRQQGVVIRQLGTNEEVMIEGSDWATESIFSSNGQLLAIWAADRFAVWDVPSHRIVLDRAADVGSVVFDHREQRLAVSSSQGQVTVFDITSGGAQELEQLTNFRAGGLTFDPADRTLFASTADRAVVAWDLTSSKGTYLRKPDVTIGEFDGLLSDIYPLAVSPDSTTLAAGAPDGAINLWELPHGGAGQTFGSDSGSPITSLVFGDGGRLFAGTASGWISRRELLADPPLGTSLRGPLAGVTATAISTDGRVVAAAGCAGGNLREAPEGSFECAQGATAVWDALDTVDGRSIPRIFHGHDDEVTSIAFADADRSIISSGRDGRVVSWNLDTGMEKEIYRSKTSNSIALSPRTPTIALAGYNGELSTLDRDTGQRTVIRPEASNQEALISVEFSPDGEMLVTGEHGGTVTLWNLQTREPRELTGPTGRTGSQISGVAFSADGTIVAAASEEGIITRWDVRTGQAVGQPLVGRSLNGDVAMSADGRLLVAGTPQGIAIWDGSDGIPLSRSLGTQPTWESSLTLAPGANPLLIGGGADSVMLWDISIDSWAQKACTRANRDLTPEEWSRYVGSTPYRPTCPTTTNPIQPGTASGPLEPDHPVQHVLDGAIDGTYQLTAVLDSCIGLNDCSRIENDLLRGARDRIEGCTGNNKCRYIINDIGVEVPLSFNGSEWEGEGPLPPQKSFVCNQKPVPTTLQITVRVLAARQEGSRWAATRAGIAFVTETAAGNTLGCTHASTSARSIGNRR